MNSNDVNPHFDKNVVFAQHRVYVMYFPHASPKIKN